MHFKHVENQIRLSTETQNDIKWLLFSPPLLKAYKLKPQTTSGRIACWHFKTQTHMDICMAVGVCGYAFVDLYTNMLLYARYAMLCYAMLCYVYATQGEHFTATKAKITKSEQ